MRPARGFTLLEMLTASAILIVAIAAATEMLLAASRLATNNQLAQEASENARLAMDELSTNLRRAGLGASGGVWVSVGGTPTRLNAIFGLDGTTGAGGSPASATATQTDDLWLVVGHKNAFREPCSASNPGAGGTVIAPGTGPITVTCTTGLVTTSPLLISNLNSAALLTGVTLASGTITYAESTLPGFSDAPEKGGFQVGDMVYQAQLLHYFIQNDPTGRPSLYRAVGKLQADALARPFSDDPAIGATLVQRGVEDLQVAFGVDTANSGDPETYTFQHGLNPAYAANVRAVRVSVVTTSALPGRNEANTVLTNPPYTSMTAENHSPAPTTDGLRRSLYTRRVELVNLGVASL